MRHALVVGAIGLFEAWLATRVPLTAAVVVGWVAAVTLVVSASIAAGFPGLLGKTADGRLPSWSRALFWPWHALVRATTRAVRHSGEPVVTEVLPGWLIGGWPHRADRFLDWPAVIDVTCELPRRGPERPYLCLPTWDATAPTVEAIERGVAFALEWRRAGLPVLVHCAHGHCRSATVLAAALVAAGEFATWEAAVSHLRAARPRVHLLPVQREALRRWTAQRALETAGTP